MEDELEYLAGADIEEILPLCPYDELVIEFLHSLSVRLLQSDECGQYPDIVSFAFWCRQGHTKKLKQNFQRAEIRMGKGLVFHIAPSNVPVNFAFSYAFGLLAGNANIVRAPSKRYPQVESICGAIRAALQEPRYGPIERMTCIVRYPRDSALTARYSMRCNVRVIWGGDQTIAQIRQFPLPPRAVELTFADRYSIAILHGDVILRLPQRELAQLAKVFYNDTYLTDQSACSSPQLVLWLGEEAGKELFWQAVEATAQGYEVSAVKAVDKYLQVCRNAIHSEVVGTLKRHGNVIYRVQLRALYGMADKLRGKYGLFYEYTLSDLAEIGLIVNETYQTVTYFGIDPKVLAKQIVENHWRGIDRIIPVGEALDLGVVWDGYDIIGTLSRIVHIA